jgi:hypothetical protein
MTSSKKHPVEVLLHRKTGRIKLRDFYKVHLGKRQGQNIWIVDGARVCQEIYPAFIMGGNDQRYRFNPPNEVWIDNRIAIEELEYTLAHELIERKLMRERGWTYDRAHSEGGLVEERRLRARQEARVAKKERSVGPVLLGGWGSDRNLADDSNRVCLNGIYRAYYGKFQGNEVWIVDGNKVRRDLDADFCFGSHDKEFPFIPDNEIWLDASMTVEEAPFTLIHELVLRRLMAAGTSYDKAYTAALIVQHQARVNHEKRAKRHEDKLEPVRYGVRERGVKM